MTSPYQFVADARERFTKRGIFGCLAIEIRLNRPRNAFALRAADLLAQEVVADSLVTVKEIETRV